MTQNFALLIGTCKDYCRLSIHPSIHFNFFFLLQTNVTRKLKGLKNNSPKEGISSRFSDMSENNMFH